MVKAGSLFPLRLMAYSIQSYFKKRRKKKSNQSHDPKSGVVGGENYLIYTGPEGKPGGESRFPLSFKTDGVSRFETVTNEDPKSGRRGNAPGS